MAKRECLLTGVELRNLENKGLGVVASSSISLGTVAIKERPYATSLLPQSGPVTCRTCFRSISAASKSLQRCRRCGAAYYCSYKCASLDRRPHRDSGECWLYDNAAGLSLAAPAGLQREAVLALRHLIAATSAQPATATAFATTAATTGTAPPLPGSPTSQPELSCHDALLAAGSALERELVGWQAAAVASLAVRLPPGAEEPEDRDEAPAVLPIGKLAEAAVAQAAVLAEAAGLGRGLGLLGAMLARAGVAGRAAAAAHTRAIQRRALRKQQREQRRQERQLRRATPLLPRQQEDGAPAGKGGGLRGKMLPLTVAPAETVAAVEPAAKAHPAAAAPIPLGSSESSYESSSSSDDGAGVAAPHRDRRRCPLPRPGVQNTLRSVLQLQSVLAAWPCNSPLTSAGSASIGTDFDVGENFGGPHGGSRCRSQPQDASGAAATETAAVRAVSMAAQALATVLTNALEVALHPPFAAGLIGASRAAGAGGAVTAAGPLDFPLALYRSSCRLNHSCRPTATYHFRPRGQISIRLIADLRAGAEVTVSYIDLALPRSRRRTQLRDKYGFGCGCERCGGGDSGAPSAATADGHKPGISPTASTNPTASTAVNADRLLSGCGTVPVPGSDESEKAGGSYGDRWEGGSAEAEGKQLARCIQRSGNGVMLAAGGADADCSITLQPPSHASPTCKKGERKHEEGHAAGHEGAVSAATATITATTAAAVAAAATSLSLEQRLQLVVRDCGDLLLQGKPTSLSDGQLAAEPVYAALIHSLDKLLAEAQIQATAEAEAPSAARGSTASRKPTGAAGAGGLAFHPQHAACLDAYTLLASAARRCARVATAAAATTTAEAHDSRPRTQPQLQNDTRALRGGGDCPEGKVEVLVDLSGGTDGQMDDDGARPHDVVPPEVRVVGWWMRAVCASLAGVAAAERLLAADPALLQMAAASWSDAASTACEMLAALFGAAAATECRPTAVAVATTATATATSTTTGSAAGVPVAGPCALLHRVWNPSPTSMTQPAQSATDRSELPANASTAGRRAGTGTASSAIMASGSQPARSGGDRPGNDGDGGGAQARDGVNWTRAALVEAVRVALAAERSALGERCPPKLPRQYRYAAMAGSVHPPQSRYREERHQDYNQHRHGHYRHGNGNGNDPEHPAAENGQRPDAATDGSDSGSGGRELRLKQRLPGRGNGPIPGGSLQGRRPRLEGEEGRLRDGDVKRTGGGGGGGGGAAAAGGSELRGYDEWHRERTARSGRCEEDTSGRARVSREDCERSRRRSAERTEQELKRDEKWTKTCGIRDSGPESEVDRWRNDTSSDRCRNRDPDRNQDSIAPSWDPDHDRARCDEHFLDYREGCEGGRIEQRRKSKWGREFRTEAGRGRDYEYGGGGEGRRRRALDGYKCAQRPGSAEHACDWERERDSCRNRGLTSDWPPNDGSNQWQNYGRSTEDRSRHTLTDRDHRAPPRGRPGGGGSGRELAAQQWEGGASPSRHEGHLRSRSGDGGGDVRPKEHDRGSSGGGNDGGNASQHLSPPPRQADRAAAAAAAAEDCCLGGALRIRPRPSSRSPARSRSRSRCRCARSPSRDGIPWAPQGSLGVQPRHQQQRRPDGAVQELERQIAKLGHSPRRRQRRSEEDVSGSDGGDGGNAKRRRIAGSEPIPQPTAAFAASAAVGSDTAGAANPGGVKKVGSSVPMAAAEDAAPGWIHWRHYTAPKATAAACAALFRECHRLDEQIHDGLGSVRRRRLPVAPAVAAAAINDWLEICAIKKLPPSPLDDVVAGASRVLVTPWRLATSCNAVGVAEPVKCMGADSSTAAVVVAVAATAGVAAVAVGHCLARLQLLLRLLLGETHGACEAAHFLPFFVRHLPYEVASELTQLAYALLSREHMPHVPMNC